MNMPLLSLLFPILLRRRRVPLVLWCAYNITIPKGMGSSIPIIYVLAY